MCGWRSWLMNIAWRVLELCTERAAAHYGTLGQQETFSRSAPYVRFAPESGHCGRQSECLLLAEAVEEVG